jgi:tight adherence protein B
MIEAAAAAAGMGAACAVLLLTAPGPLLLSWPLPAGLRQLAARAVRREGRVVGGAGWPWLTLGRFLLLEAAAAATGFAAGLSITGLPALAAAGAAAGAGLVRAAVHARGRSLRRTRQDAVLESVRMLKSLLETGGLGVQQALVVLGGRGPVPLRREFRVIAAASRSGRQREAWAAARERLADPLFDLLAAAVLVQRPSGGELGPLFNDLEQSVAGIYEVAREAEALQVQSRSAAATIGCLPFVFLLILSSLRSPYLDPYREPAGEAFLAAMLALIGSTYLLVLRWLRLPLEPRMASGDA